MNDNEIQISQSVMIIYLIRWFLRSWKNILAMGPRQQYSVVFQYDMGIILRTYYGVQLGPMFSSCGTCLNLIFSGFLRKFISVDILGL